MSSVFISRILATDFNTGIVSVSLKLQHTRSLPCTAKFLSSQSSSTSISRNSLNSNSSWPVILVIASRRTQQKTRFPNNSSTIIEACLPRRCKVTAVLLLLLAYTLPRECIVPCYALRAPFRLLIPLLQSSPTRNYNHSQLFITLCHIYIPYNHTRSWLQSCIALLHWLTSQLSNTVSNYHTLYILTFWNSRWDLTLRIHFLRLLSRTDFWTLS
jgi:hypothetical protein